MKKILALVVLLCSFGAVLYAMDGYHHPHHLSREEFRIKQKAYIIEQAGLTKQEAAAFFPVYYELQDKKSKLNDEAWVLIRKGRNMDTTEAQYEEINEKVVENRLQISQLEKDYLQQFKKVLTAKKIYLVRRAELRFHREMIKEMHHRKNCKK